ncbi:DUF262 domain-containing protein [Bernardetia sp. Wsw4-3y2]|uniref:GmrSD restriction endonuclease domain-containing protein n=1 Tax=Bernardetia sp. Wsw4-3y2 TaxID=3127471 RepID=UPI0030D405EE
MERTHSIESLIKDVQNEYAVLPEFQRDFVWEIAKTVDLFDSIVKDIFIGAIIYGVPSFEITTRAVDDRERKTRGKRRNTLLVKHFSKAQIDEKQKIDKSNFRLILDGQQRITSMYRALEGVDDIYFIRKNDSELDNDLSDKKLSEQTLEEVLYNFDTEEDDTRMSIKLSDVWKTMNEDYFEDELKNTFFKKTSYYKANSEDSNFNEIEEFRIYLSLQKKIQNLFKAEKLLSYYLLDMSLDRFVLFFERSNSRGVQLNFIDILTAKLYEGFNLKKKIKEFESKNSGYEISPEIIVRAIAYIVSRDRFEESGKGMEIHRTFILTELNAEHFNLYWEKVSNWYKKTLEFLFNNHLAISQYWIPYPNMIIPLIIFQKELGYGFDQMNDNQREFIFYWYWCSIFSQRYTGSSNEKIIQDCNILSLIAKGEKIKDRTFLNKLSKIAITSWGDLYSYDKRQNAVYRGILNFINYSVKGLLDWNNTSKINFMDNIDDHHIFPRDFIDKNLSDDDPNKDFINSVVNRTLIPKITNIKIGNKAPSAYLSEIKQRNPSIEQSLKTHYIDTDILNGQYDNNFGFFLELRAGEIFNQIKTEVVDKFQEIKDMHYQEPQNVNVTSVKISATYYNKKVDAVFNPQSKTIQYNGELFDSPSSAGMKAKQDLGAPEGATVNGWRFWKYLDPYSNETKFIDHLRQEDTNVS